MTIESLKKKWLFSEGNRGVVNIFTDKVEIMTMITENWNCKQNGTKRMLRAILNSVKIVLNSGSSVRTTME